MKEKIFTQALTLDVLTEISKSLSEYANVQEIILDQDDGIIWNIYHGRFRASLLDSDIINATEKSYPFIPILEKGRELVASSDTLKEYLVVVVHMGNDFHSKISFRDVTEDMEIATRPFIDECNQAIDSVSIHPYKRPRTFITFKSTPVNVILLIPYLKNNRKNETSYFLGRAQDGSIFVDYERKKNDPFFTYSPEFMAPN